MNFPDMEGDVDESIVAHTLAASRWGFGEATYDLAGPFRPVEPLPAVNQVNAGQAVPVKFSLGVDAGPSVVQAGFPTSSGARCTGGPTDSSPTTSNGLGLTYHHGSGVYTYHWKTSKAWAGHCRNLTIRFLDGQELTARFRFE